MKFRKANERKLEDIGIRERYNDKGLLRGAAKSQSAMHQETPLIIKISDDDEKNGRKMQ